MTVKEELAKIKFARHRKKQEDDQRDMLRRKVEQSKQEDALEAVANALEGFEFEPVNSRWGKGYKVCVGNWKHKEIYVIVEWKTRSVKLSDEMPPEDMRSLEVSLGFAMNCVEQILSVSEFSKGFAEFLDKNFCS